jgi:phage host-nuclease inhibitor protein Gam
VSEPAIYLSVGTLLALVGAIVKLTWGASKVAQEIREEMSAEVDNLQRDISSLTRTSADRAETLRHEFGETGNALRTKIHEVETWNRDTFVRKDSFDMVIGRLEKSLEKMSDKIEDRIDRLADRLQKPD